MESVTTFLEDHVKAVKLVEVRGQELHYVLPLSGARASVLTQLFRELEDAKERLGVTSYGLTACSMEEVTLTPSHPPTLSHTHILTSTQTFLFNTCFFIHILFYRYLLN